MKDIINKIGDETCDFDKRIRFVGFINRNESEFIWERLITKNPRLTYKDKSILRLLSLRGYNLVERNRANTGVNRYVIAKYDILKRITITFKEDFIIIITTDESFDKEQELIDMIDQIRDEKEYQIRDEKEYQIRDEKEYQIRDEENPIRILFQNLIDEDIDISKEIRIIGICDYFGHFIKFIKKKGIDTDLTDDELKELFKGSAIRWKFRKKLKEKIGDIYYTINVFEKIIRIITSLDEDFILRVSLEPNVNYENFLNKLLKNQSKQEVLVALQKIKDTDEYRNTLDNKCRVDKCDCHSI